MLQVSNVSKIYQTGNGIFDINISLFPGEIYAVIGPNGVGKSTLLRCIAGISEVDSGEILLGQLHTIERVCKKNIGFAPEYKYGFPDMSILELLEMVSELKFGRVYWDQIDDMLQKFQLKEHSRKMVRNCSMGMLKKLDIIISFMGLPKLILLDEPTNGVDTEGIIVLKEYMQNAADQGAIIIITSHVLDFIDKVADQVIFLKNGRIENKRKNTGSLEEDYKNIFLQSKL